jgi:hypothetical protein
MAGLAVTASAASGVGFAEETPEASRPIARGVCAKQLHANDDEFHVQVQFFRSSTGAFSVHGPYPFVRERVEAGVRTLYYASGGGTETPLATMTSTDGWEIIGDPSGLWDILTVVPNES